jgi:hypothetical protein
MKCETIGDVVRALPDGVWLSPRLQKNLAVAGLAINGLVVITGFADGVFLSENTAAGSMAVVDCLAADLANRLG